MIEIVMVLCLVVGVCVVAALIGAGMIFVAEVLWEFAFEPYLDWRARKRRERRERTA